MTNLELIFNIIQATSIIALVLSIWQFILLTREYKEKKLPKVTPYLDTINENNSVLLVLKFYNNSKVVAQNIQIIINEEWINRLDSIKSEVTQNSIKILKTLSSKKDIYITDKQEHSYLIISKFQYKRLIDIPLIITVKYYKKNGKLIKKQTETFRINMESIGGKLSNPSEATRNQIIGITELEKVNDNLEEIKERLEKKALPSYPLDMPNFR